MGGTSNDHRDPDVIAGARHGSDLALRGRCHRRTTRRLDAVAWIAMDHQRLRFPDLPDPGSASWHLPAAFRDPLRITILVGLLVMLVGDLLPWLRIWMPNRGFFETSGFERAGDAGLVLEFALVILALTFSDQAWNSKTTLLVAGPVMLGIVCLFVLRNAWADGASYIRSLDVYGGYGDFLPWFWVAVAGAIVVTAGGAIELWRSRGRLSFRLGLTRTAAAGAIGGVAGGVGGFMAGIRIAELLTAGDIAWVSTSALVLLAIFLGFLGAYAGAVGATSLARTSRRQ
jgi:hypothetical protein